ncbi:hypothetical protein [Elioraea sp.]|uniref:hypothetical protein n=1 Tax=Elioraea sp. TaxID=2185103 RepID=UPI0025BBAA01|nr:hypothetical protein [Elioraea sp.]
MISSSAGSLKPAPHSAASQHSPWGSVAEAACLAFGLAALAWLIVVTLRMLVSPAPQEMREGALVLTTLALLDGRNPYAVGEATGAANLYGILYPLLVTPAALVFGPGLATHRIVAALGILAATVIVWQSARRAGAAAVPALLAALLTLAGWLYWVGPTVRPDGVGLACLIGALAVAAPDPGSPRRFAFAVALSLAGFAAKIYFAGGMMIVAAFVFLFVGWRRGIVFGLASLAALVLWAGLLALTMPVWASLVLGANLGATSYEVGHLLRQGLDWLVFSLPIIAAGVAAVIVLPRARWGGEAGFWAFAAVCGLAVLLASLGGHGGAHMTYFFHLLTPPLAIAIVAAARGHAAVTRALVLALPPAVLLNAHWFVYDPGRFAPAEARFAIAGALIAEARAPLVTTEFAALAALAGHVPVETGHSEYALGPEGREATREAIAAALLQRRYDLVIVNRNNGGLVHARDVEAAGYRRVAEMPVDLVWAMQAWGADVWRPPPD